MMDLFQSFNNIISFFQRLHEGVYRDLERQKYKEHFNLLDKHTTLALQLETENSKMLRARKPQA